jgi:RNA polymerase sigma-70 factor (ECF subfamily)
MTGRRAAMIFLSSNADSRIVRNVLRGDREAFGKLVERYLTDAYAVSWTYVRNSMDADDAVQESFLKAFQKLDTLKNREKFRPWLLAIVRQTCIRLLDLRRRDQRLAEDGSNVEQATEPDIEQREMNTLLNRHLAPLTNDLREVILLHYFTGLSTAEIGEHLGISREAVKKRLQRARESLGETLLQECGDVFRSKASKRDRVTRIMSAILALPAAWRSQSGATPNTTNSTPAKGGPRMMKTIIASIVAVVIVAGSIRFGLAKFADKDVGPRPSAMVVAASANEPEPQLVTAPSRDTNVDKPSRKMEVEVAAKKAVAIASAQPHIQGRVVDEAGNAIVGADIALYHAMKQSGLDDAIVDKTKSGEDGQFGFSAELNFAQKPSPANRQDSYVIVASDPDHAIGWKNVTRESTSDSYDVVMTSAQTGELTVVDSSERPLEGVRVWLIGAGDNESANPLFRNYVEFGIDLEVVSGLTGADGKIEFKNLPKTRCSFYAEKPGYARSWSPRIGRTIVLTKGATISGRILTAQRAPIPNVLVHCDSQWMHSPNLARTDAEGTYTFKDLPADGWNMSVWEDGSTGNGTYEVFALSGNLATPKQEIQLSPEQVIRDLDIVAYAGTLVRCKVVWPATENSVPGARMFAYFGDERREGYTDETGIWTFSAFPGAVTVHFMLPPDGVYVDDTQMIAPELKFDAKGEEMDVVFEAPPIEGKLIPAKGAVKKGAFSFISVNLFVTAGSYSWSSGSGFTPPSTRVNAEDGSFNLKNVPAGRTLLLYAITDDRANAGISAAEISADTNAYNGLSISLAPTFEGTVTLTDRDGKLHAGKSVTFEPVVENENLVFSRRNADTDEYGQVTLDGIIPGLAYHFFDADSRDEETGALLLNTTLVVIPQS